MKRLLWNLPFIGSFFTSEPGRRVRRRLYQVRAPEVERIGAALDRAGVLWFLGGGWGVDALVGRRTRSHGDLDLCVDVASDGEARAVQVLEELGYQRTVRRAPSGHRFPFRSVVRDSGGRTIDVILVTRLERSPTSEDVPVLGSDDCVLGTIVVGKRTVPVPCLSAELQLALHTGYLPQERDRRDVDAICDTFGLPAPSIYRRHSPKRSPAAWVHHALWAVITRCRGVSAVVVLVPEASELLSAVGSASSGSMPPHITIAYPFAPPRRMKQRDTEQLSSIAAAAARFDVALAEMDHHELTTYLTVRPEDPFRQLAVDILGVWPEWPPYGDADLDVPPHLTLGYGVLPEEIADSVEPFVPLHVEVDRLALMVNGMSGRWRIAAEFPLGGGSPVERADDV